MHACWAWASAGGGCGLLPECGSLWLLWGADQLLRKFWNDLVQSNGTEGGQKSEFVLCSNFRSKRLCVTCCIPALF